MSTNPFLLNREEEERLNPFLIPAEAKPAEDVSFVDPNIDSGDLGMSEEDYAPKNPKEDLDSVGIFKGVMQNIGSALSIPAAAGVALYDALDNSAQQIARSVFTEDGSVGDLMSTDALLPDGERFANTFVDNIYTGGDEASQVRDAVGDQRELWRTVEALPPAKIAAGPMKLGMTGLHWLDKLQDTRAGQVVSDINQRVLARGERMKANKDYLSGRATGVNFLPDEAIAGLENADPRMKELFMRQLDDSKRLNNGWGDPTASAYNVLADQFQHRSTLLAKAGRGYLDDMKAAREKIARGEIDYPNNADGSVVVRTDGTVLKRTGDLRDDMRNVLKDEFNIKMGPDGKLDFSLSPIAEGEKKLQQAITRFMNGTSSHGDAYTQNLSSFDELDYLKKYLQRASYNNTRKHGAGGETNALIQRMSGMVNDTLRGISPEYAKANDGLAKVIETFKDLRSATGIDVDVNRAMFETDEWRKLALNTRKIASNYNAGVDLDHTWRTMDEALKGEVGRHINADEFAAIDGINPRQLAIFGSYMEALYGAGKPNSFKSLVEAGLADGANHGLNFAANAAWGNAVGASASGIKWAGQNLPTQGLRDRAAGKEIQKKLTREEEVMIEIEENLREMFKRP